MTVKHVNFYENLKEAQFRLLRTIVVYDKIPYYVLAITNHKGDGVFRIYLDPIGKAPDVPRNYPEIDHLHSEAAGIGGIIDAWLETPQGKASGAIRKRMDSSYFNKFRPYPLGMVNVPGERAYYIERQPARRHEQGLIRTSVTETPMALEMKRGVARGGPMMNVDIHSPAMRDCILGNYPSFSDCMKNLRDPEVTNESAAFNRLFALVRGPIGLVFLAYKEDIVGVMPHGDSSVLHLGKGACHVKEAVADLKLFGKVACVAM